MAAFTAGGHEWRVEIGLRSLRHLRAEAGLDLGRLNEGLAQTILADPVTVGRALWVLVRDQADGRGITTADDFYDLFPDADALEGACEALVNAVLDFFLPGRSAELKKRLPAVTEQINREAGRRLAAAADRIAEAPTSSASAGSSPASAG